MRQSFGPDTAADRAPRHWVCSGRDLGLLWGTPSTFEPVHQGGCQGKERSLGKSGQALLLSWYVTFHNWLRHHDGWKEVPENLNFWKAQESQDWRNYWEDEGKYLETGARMQVSSGLTDWFPCPGTSWSKKVNIS